MICYLLVKLVFVLMLTIKIVIDKYQASYVHQSIGTWIDLNIFLLFTEILICFILVVVIRVTNRKTVKYVYITLKLFVNAFTVYGVLLITVLNKEVFNS